MSARKIICRGRTGCTVPGCSCAAAAPKAPAFVAVCVCCRPRFDAIELEHLIGKPRHWSDEYRDFVERMANRSADSGKRMIPAMDRIQDEILLAAAKNVPEPEDA